MVVRTPPAIHERPYLVVAGRRDGESTIVATGADTYAEAVGKMDMVRRVYPGAPVAVEAPDGRVWVSCRGRR